MAENFLKSPKNKPKQNKTLNIKIKDVPQIPNRINSKTSMPRHVMIILLRTRDKKKIILKAVTEK